MFSTNNNNNMNRNRTCWCGSYRFHHIFTLTFLSAFGIENYDLELGCCKKCGSIILLKLIDELDVEKYYSNLDLYSSFEDEGTEKQGRVNKSLRQIEACKPYLESGCNVLDVGCGSGLTLSLYREKFNANVFGSEISNSNIICAQKKYSISPEKCSVYQLDQRFKGNFFDMISVSHVLEHLYYPDLAIKKVFNLLKNDSFCYVEVPDVENFDVKILFNYLTYEHVNYFSKRTLEQLMSNNGFETCFLKTIYNDKITAPYCPVIVYIGKKSFNKKTKNYSYADEGLVAMKKYTVKSTKKIADINNKLEKYVKSQYPTIIWCAGSFASKLLANTHLNKMNIVQVVDSSKALQGKMLGKYIIENPARLSDKATHVLIASGAFNSSINEIICENYPELQVININDS